MTGVCCRCGQQSRALGDERFCCVCMVILRGEVDRGLKLLGDYLAAWAGYRAYCADHPEVAL